MTSFMAPCSAMNQKGSLVASLRVCSMGSTGRQTVASLRQNLKMGYLPGLVHNGHQNSDLIGVKKPFPVYGETH